MGKANRVVKGAPEKTRLELVGGKEPFHGNLPISISYSR